MITGQTFPLGVIYDIYCPRRALSAPLAPSRLRLLCLHCGFFWIGRCEAGRRKVPACSFTSSWLTGRSVGCAAQESCLWSGGLCIMEQSIPMAHTHMRACTTDTQTHPISSTGSSSHIQPPRTALSVVCNPK